MKRIAVLFHGHLRSYDQTYSSFNNHIRGFLENNGYKVDVFIHTWDEEEFTSKTWHEGVKDSKPTEMSKIVSAYNPQKVMVDKQNIPKEEREMFGRPYTAIKCVWYGFQQAFNLMLHFEKESKFKYDSIIVTRPDVLHYNDILLEEIEDSKHLYQPAVYVNGAAGDVFFYGGRDVIEESVCSFYQNFDNLHSIENLKNTTWQEFTFNEHIKTKTRVKKSKYCMPRDWRLQRSWWDLDHKVGHRKWDKETAEKDIRENDDFKFFR